MMTPSTPEMTSSTALSSTMGGYRPFTASDISPASEDGGDDKSEGEKH
jgi:hypothetical protein